MCQGSEVWYALAYFMGVIMQNKPNVNIYEDGSKMWSHTFENFKAKVYVPVSRVKDNVINYGFAAPYLLVFEENESDEPSAKSLADGNGLAEIAAGFDSSVVFIYPTCKGGWENATEELFTEIIANSKIHECYEDGYAILNNRFTKSCDGYAIRGAIFRTFLFGKGKSADYIAGKLIKTVKGEGLWGPADVAPTACILEGLSDKPLVGRKDMPIVSVGNSVEINEYIMDAVEDCYIDATANYPVIFDEFLRHYKRWGWDGTLEESPDFDELGMVEEMVVETLKTSPDNMSKDKGTKEHKVGYIAYYNKHIFQNGPVPMLLCFHGGGDSAMFIAQVAEWYKVAHDFDFLLICIEDHLNSTASEMIELLDKLGKRYNIDRSRVYATGFSMGGCKTWDIYQEYPKYFAALAPMDATFDVGFNVYGNKVEKEINRDERVPVFYAGGEETPLPELPFQAQKCLDRIAYVLKINGAKKAEEYSKLKFEDAESWENRIWGLNGDREEKLYDPSRDSTLTIQYFDSEDGNCYCAFGSVSKQGHDCRHHTCEQAWKFMSKFSVPGH